MQCGLEHLLILSTLDHERHLLGELRAALIARATPSP